LNMKRSVKKNVAVFEHLFWRWQIQRRQTIFKFLKKYFDKGHEVKKQDIKNYCNTKMPQHFHRLFSVLKIELKA
jgi:hypothetical protein